MRECAGLMRWAMRVGWILIKGYRAAWLGHVVLCDRHPIEVRAVRPERTRAGAALERVLFGRLCPRPDAVIVLDAPAGILFERTGEHSREKLERWRRGYAEVFGSSDRTTVVSTEQPPEASIAAASQAVWDALRIRRRW